MNQQGYFTIKSKLNLDELQVGQRIEESDFSTLTPEGSFIQLEYHEPDQNVSIKEYEVYAGVWTITHNQQKGMFLEPTSFVNDRILEEFIHTKHINDKINLFFNKINVYYELGFEVPKRAALLYGPAGTGKSTSISKIIRQYENDNKTAIIVWPTSKYEAVHVKDFVKTFKYNNVERLIMVVEDIGGIEMDGIRMKSDSSLLSLLDNQEKTFTIPVFIIATTNHPEIFLGNLTNRPNRFDDKIEVGYPDSAFRVALLKFFTKDTATTEDIELMKLKVTEKFSPAHIREVVIRAKIYDKSYSEVIKDIVNEIQNYENGFETPKRLGTGIFD